MGYTILAGVCQHPIRTSSSLPWSGSNLDFEVPYCSELCARGLQARTERRAAESGYETSRPRYDRGSISRDTYRDTRRRFNNSRAALSQFNREHEERDNRERRARGSMTMSERGRRFAGSDDPAWLAFRREVDPRHGQRARIEDTSSHRRESQYRDQTSYRRGSTAYDPGKYRDRSGSGFFDTSNPPRSRSPTRRDTHVVTATRRDSHAPTTRRVSSTRSSRSDAYLDMFDEEELEERRRMLERALSRYK